jgi:hypothetical protein
LSASNFPRGIITSKPAPKAMSDLMHHQLQRGSTVKSPKINYLLVFNSPACCRNSPSCAC